MCKLKYLIYYNNFFIQNNNNDINADINYINQIKKQLSFNEKNDA